VPVLADPTEDDLNNQLQQQQNQLNQNKSALDQIQDKRQAMEQNIEKFDFQIEGYLRQIDDTKKKIDQTQKDISSAEIDIKKAEADIQEEKDLFNKRIRALYISGSTGYLNILLEAKGLNDLFSRIEAIIKITEADKKIIADLNLKKEEINKKKEALQKKNDELLALKKENEQKLAKLNQSKSDQAKLIADVRAQERQLSSNVNNASNSIDDLKKQIEALRVKAAGKSGTMGSVYLNGDFYIVNLNDPGWTNVTNNPAVLLIINSLASNGLHKFMNTPYLWGGTTPYDFNRKTGGFDCSGLVQYAYRQFGVDLPRTTYYQVNSGTYVPREQLKTGDLILFGSWDDIHHIGLYLGKYKGVDYYVHAPRTGDFVKASPLTRSDYLIARRVM
jgi:peptidoglycan hydrolase CwlO-like protein